MGREISRARQESESLQMVKKRGMWNLPRSELSYPYGE